MTIVNAIVALVGTVIGYLGTMYLIDFYEGWRDRRFHKKYSKIK
jgi:hypothetical protein